MRDNGISTVDFFSGIVDKCPVATFKESGKVVRWYDIEARDHYYEKHPDYHRKEREAACAQAKKQPE